MANREVPEECKVLIRSVLLSKVGGIRPDHVMKDYRNLSGQQLLPRKIGFRNLVELIASIPDVARIKIVNGEEKIFGVLDNPNIMNHTAKKAQFIPNECDDDELSGKLMTEQRKELMHRMQPNLRGLYCLMLPKRSELDRQKVNELFSKYGVVQETSTTPKFIFVRYASKLEAMKAYEALKDPYKVDIPTEKDNPRHVVKLKDVSGELPDYPKVKAKNESITGIGTEKDQVEAFIGNLPLSTREEDIADLVKNFDVLNIRVKTSTKSNDKKFAFVLLPNKEESDRLAKALHRTTFKGSTIIAQTSYTNVEKRPEMEDKVILQNMLHGGITGTQVVAADVDSGLERINKDRISNSNHSGTTYGTAGGRGVGRGQYHKTSVSTNSQQATSTNSVEAGQPLDDKPLSDFIRGPGTNNYYQDHKMQQNRGLRGAGGNRNQSQAAMSAEQGNRFNRNHQDQQRTPGHLKQGDGKPTSQLSSGGDRRRVEMLEDRPPGLEPYDGPPGLEPYDGPPGLEPYDGPPGLEPYDGPPGLEPYDGPPGLEPYDGPPGLEYVGSGRGRPSNRGVNRQQGYQQQQGYRRQNSGYRQQTDQYYTADDQMNYHSRGGGGGNHTVNDQDVNRFELFVGSFPYETTSEDLMELFSAYNPAYVKMKNNQYPGQTFAFVVFDDYDDSLDALSYLDGVDYYGRILKVSFGSKSIANENDLVKKLGNLKCTINVNMGNSEERSVRKSKPSPDIGTAHLSPQGAHKTTVSYEKQNIQHESKEIPRFSPSIQGNQETLNEEEEETLYVVGFGNNLEEDVLRNKLQKHFRCARQIDIPLKTDGSGQVRGFAFIKFSNADADTVLNDPNYINFNGHDLQIKSRNIDKSVSNTTQSSRAMSEGNRNSYEKQNVKGESKEISQFSPSIKGNQETFNEAEEETLYVVGFGSDWEEDDLRNKLQIHFRSASQINTPLKTDGSGQVRGIAFIKLSKADADAVINDPNYNYFNGHDLRIKYRNTDKSVSNTTPRSMFEENKGFSGGGGEMTKMEIQRSDVGKIIDAKPSLKGKGGSKIRELTETSGAKIKVLSKEVEGDQVPVEITGDESCRNKAKELIEEILNETSYGGGGGESNSCFKCNETGHMARDCPNADSGGGGFSSGGGFGGSSSGAGVGWGDNSGSSKAQGGFGRVSAGFGSGCQNEGFGGGGDEMTKMEIQRSDVGKVIGKGGSKIKELTETSGAKIKVLSKEVDGDEIPVEITGEESCRNKAKELIEEILNSTSYGGGGGGSNCFSGGDGGGMTTMEIQRSDAGKIIGRGGSKIKELTETSGAKIKVLSKESDGDQVPVEITGDESCRNKAKELIEEILNSTSYGGGGGGSNSCYKCNETGHMARDCPNADSGGGGFSSGGGFGGSSSGADVGWGDDSGSSKAQGGFGGVSAGFGSGGQNEGFGGGEMTKMEIQRRDVGKIIGSGGSKIKELSETSGAKIKVLSKEVDGDEIPVEITGDESSRNKAKELIEEILNSTSYGGGGGGSNSCFKCNETGHMARDCPNADSGFRGGDGGGMTTMEIQRSDAGRIIGKGGSKIKELTEASGAKIKVFGKETDGDQVPVEITGDESCRNKAKELIEEILNSTSYGGGGGGSNSCFKCNETGHMARDCPNADSGGGGFSSGGAGFGGSSSGENVGWGDNSASSKTHGGFGGGSGGQNQGVRLFVANLPFDYDTENIREELRTHFSKATDVKVVTGENEKHKGFGFVQFDNESDAEAVMNDPGCKRFLDRDIRLEYSDKKGKGSNSRGGRGDGDTDHRPACFKCNETGHMARDCPNADSVREEIKLYVGNLPSDQDYDVLKNQLQQHFSQAASVYIPKDSATGLMKRFGFIHFHKQSDIDAVMNDSSYADLNGHQLNLQYKNTRSDTSQNLCKFYLQGNCTNDDCKFIHEGDQKITVCKFFQQGNCTKDPCSFSHDEMQNEISEFSHSRTSQPNRINAYTSSPEPEAMSVAPVEQTPRSALKEKTRSAYGDTRPRERQDSWETVSTCSVASAPESAIASPPASSLKRPAFNTTPTTSQQIVPKSMTESRLKQSFQDCFPDSAPVQPTDLPPQLELCIRHIEGDGYFWGQCVNEDTDQLHMVMGSISKPEYIQCLSPFDSNSKRAAVMFMGEWARAWVEAYTGDKAKVLFVDWGNSELVSVEELRSLDEEIWTLAPIAIPFKLDGYMNLAEHLNQKIAVQVIGATNGIMEFKLLT